MFSIPADASAGFSKHLRGETAGTTLARLDGVDGMPLEVVDEQGLEVAQRFFSVEGDLLRTHRAVMPAMLTLDERVIRQDCLGYLMERYPLPA